MKKNTQKKEFYMEVKTSMGRFLSIFFIVALGVAFFSGIRATDWDMRLSVDQYCDDKQLMDIKTVCDMGLTDGDVQALEDVEGVERVAGGYSSDVLCDVNDNEKVFHVMSVVEDMNDVVVTEGRMPEAADECLMDAYIMEQSGYQIGDTIQFKSGDDSEITDTFCQDTFTIVGVGNSSAYMSIYRGSSTIGNGDVYGFIVVAPEAFDLSVYSEIYLTVAGAKEVTAFTDTYDDTVDAVIDRIEEIKGEREKIRHAEVIDEANEELEEGRQELEDAKKELADARVETDEKLANALRQIQDGESKLADARAQIASGKKEIDQAKQTLNEKQSELNAGRQQYEEGKAQLDSGKKELETKEQEYQESIMALEEGEAGLKIWRDQLDANWAQYESIKDLPGYEETAQTMYQELQNSEIEYTAKEQELQQGRLLLEQGGQELDAARKELEQNEQILAATLTELNSGQQQIDDARSTLTEKEKELKSAEAQIADSQEELNQAKIDYEDGKREAEKEFADAEEEIADAEQELADAEEEIADIKEPKWYIYGREALVEYNSYGENADRIKAIGKVFPILFFLVAALISLTTMTRMVEEQRVQIGTMKALGYGKAAIAWKYIKYAFLATLGGSVLGVLVGEKVIPYVIVYAYQIMYPSMPDIVIPYNVGYAVYATVISLGCTIGATILSCYKELAAQPAVLMRPPSPKNGKRILLEHVTFLWKRLNFTWKSTVRNLFRYKKRFFMTVFGIGGCMGLIIVGFGVKDSIFHIGTIQYGELQKFDGTAYMYEDVKEKDQESLDEMLRSEKDITAYTNVYMKKQTVKSGGTEKEVYLVVPQDTDEIENYLVFRDRRSHEQYAFDKDSVILTEKMAKMLDVKVGDPILIGDKGEEKEVTITEICENYMSHYLYLSADVYAGLYGDEPEYNTVYLKVDDTEDAELKKIGNELLDEPAVYNVMYTVNFSDQLDRMLESLNMVILILIISAGMLAFVVLYNLNNINITERRRELATLKVLGFFDGEVAGYVYRENVLLTIIGIVLGAVLGKLLHSFIIQTVEIDTTMFGRDVYLASYLYSIGFTILFSLIVNTFVYFKLKKIDMVESLKSVE